MLYLTQPKNMMENDIDKDRLELALEAAGLDLWENNLVTGEVTRKAMKTFAELGYTDSETASLVDDMFTIVHPDDVSIIKNTVSEYLSGVTSQYRCEFRLRSKKNDTWVWYANYGRSMDCNGQGQRFIGVTFNINENAKKNCSQPVNLSGVLWLKTPRMPSRVTIRAADESMPTQLYVLFLRAANLHCWEKRRLNTLVAKVWRYMKKKFVWSLRRARTLSLS
jgi:hypothetical protein